MPSDPKRTSLAMAQAIGIGDLAGAASYFTRNACFITPDATAICGRERIRPILAQLIELDTQIEIETGSLLLAGEVALGSERWRIRIRGVNGSRLLQTYPATMVLRHVENSWKLAIAAPWGWGR